LDQRIKELWVKALRSGEYKQTQHFLNCDRGFCCIGVLADLYIKETNEGHWQQTTTPVDGVTPLVFNDVNASILPVEVMEWAGLVNELIVTSEHGKVSFYELNDSLRLSFVEISNIIEKQL